MDDRIRLDQTYYWPISEELPKERLETLASRCFTIETSLQEEGVEVIGYPDTEPRIMDARMLLKICDGMSQGEFFFHLQAIEDEARSDWPAFLRMASQVSLEDEFSEDLFGDEDGITD